MASVSMTASLIPSTSLAKVPSSTSRRLIVAKASTSSFEGEKASLELKNERKEESNGRRELLFTAAAAAAMSVARIAMADVEPKNGTPEAKKKYGPICVTMPTARVCRK